MRPRMAFEMYVDEIDFIKPQILLFSKTYPQIPILFVIHHIKDKAAILRDHPELSSVGKFISRRRLEAGLGPPVGLFLTTEQWKGIGGIPSYCCFHGQPAKGLTIQPGKATDFTGFFLLGPLQRECIEKYYEYYGYLCPRPTLHDIGYPKSDDLINGKYSRENTLNELGLAQGAPTILYAPAFNECASLREQGPEIIGSLLRRGKWNVIAKLAVDCWQPANNMYANGGKNWFEALKTFEANSSFRLYKNTLIDPLLAVADVMVTDVSSVAFEFLVLGKPVVYIDTPRFFTEYLKMYFPHEDTEKWKDIAYINAGRKYGTLVDNLDDLPGAIESALARGHSIDKAIEMRKLFLYNPGRSAETMVEAMHEIYMDNRHFRNSMAYRLINKAISFFPKFSGRMRRSMAKRILGGRANWLGLDYINCKDTVRAAAKAGLSINDYLERGELSPRKRGRRDRIIAEMDKRGLLDVEGGNILEIGAGTGRFLEKTIARRPRSYEIYEIDKGWSRHIESAYGCFKDVNLLVREADGVSLKDTPTSSLDYVYAHGVFVYTPIIVTAGYLREMARVCNMGAKVVFDAYYDADWSFRTIRAWAHAGHLFPVVLPRNLLEAIFADLGFDIIAEFTEIHGASCSRYIALKKVVEKSL